MSDPDRSNIPLILVLWCAGLVAAAQFGKISVIYDLLGETYSGRNIGLMVSVVGLVGLIFGTTAGLFVQRIGYRRVLVGALLVGTALSAFQSTGPAYPLMMASRVIEGFSHLSIVVAGPVLIATVTARRHFGAAMSLWSSFFGVSFALTAWLGAKLVASSGEPALFLVHAALMAAVAIALWFMAPARIVEKDTSRISISTLIRQHRDIYASPFIAAPALGFVFYTAMYVALLTLVPTLFTGPQRIMIATSMPLISIVVSLTLGVWLLTHFKAVVLVRAGFIVSGIAGLLMWALWGLGDFSFVAALILGAAMGLVQGASFASIPQLNESTNDRAYAAGAVAQMGNLGTTTGTPILALLIAGFGITGVLIFVLPLAIGGVAMTTWLALRRANTAG